MPADPIAARYAAVLFDAAKGERQLDETLGHLAFLGRLIREEPALRALLWNPDVDPPDKVGVLDRALQGSWPALARAFVQMVASLGRTELLPEIVESFQARVDEERGRLRVLVRSAHPLPDGALERLRSRLERQERKTVELRTELAPELLGGIQVHLDHRVIEGSVRRQLQDLRQRLMSVRVH
jgi:F-type H+-transporting ATPase subunit delta